MHSYQNYGASNVWSYVCYSTKVYPVWPKTKRASLRAFGWKPASFLRGCPNLYWIYSITYIYIKIPLSTTVQIWKKKKRFQRVFYQRKTNPTSSQNSSNTVYSTTRGNCRSTNNAPIALSKYWIFWVVLCKLKLRVKNRVGRRQTSGTIIP